MCTYCLAPPLYRFTMVWLMACNVPFLKTAMHLCRLLNPEDWCCSVMCLGVQVQTYLYKHSGVANPANTYIIFIGANDYLNTVNMTASATVSGVVQAINQTMVNLYNGGARQ